MTTQLQTDRQRDGKMGKQTDSQIENQIVNTDISMGQRNVCLGQPIMYCANLLYLVTLAMHNFFVCFFFNLSTIFIGIAHLFEE